ncbi:MAG: ATP-binding cassette domain-containing protein, partial [Acidimicrobiales bacterium]
MRRRPARPLLRRAGRAVGSGPPAWLGGLAAAYLLVPIALVVTRLGPGHWNGITSHALTSAAITSILAATISTGIAALLGVPLGYALARRTGRLWRAIGVAVQLPLALPPLMGGILLVNVVGPYTAIGEAFGR